MDDQRRFRFQDLIVIACVGLMMLALVMPAWTTSARRSRAAVCRNNMKLIGVGLELWHRNSSHYPVWDYVHIDGNSHTLNPWTDQLALNPPFDDREFLEEYFENHPGAYGSPNDFIEVVDDDKIFICPADHLHPHRINEERSRAWGFWRSSDEDGYQYSYAIGTASVFKQYHAQSDSQILSADGLWTWGMNLSGVWVNDPNAGWDYPTWYSNTVGYWHKGGTANLLLRDLHVEIHKYPPNTNEIFFGEPGESLNAFY